MVKNVRKLVTQPVKGQLKKANVENTLTKFAEVKVDEVSEMHLGKEVSIADFD